MIQKTLDKLVHRIDKKEARTGMLIILLFIAGSLLISRYIGQENLERVVAQAGIRGPVLIIGRKITSVVIAPFAGSIAYVIAGGLYGLQQAIIYSMIGDAIGMSLAFLIGRKRGKKAVSRLVGPSHIEEVMHLVSHLDNVKKFILTRLVLFPLSDFINYAAGMSKIGYWIYIVVSVCTATIFALIPIVFGHLLI